jgi:hypothetical protein
VSAPSLASTTTPSVGVVLFNSATMFAGTLRGVSRVPPACVAARVTVPHHRACCLCSVCVLRVSSVRIGDCVFRSCSSISAGCLGRLQA